jgi:hypothetical protein
VRGKTLSLGSNATVHLDTRTLNVWVAFFGP